MKICEVKDYSVVKDQSFGAVQKNKRINEKGIAPSSSFSSHATIPVNSPNFSQLGVYRTFNVNFQGEKKAVHDVKLGSNYDKNTKTLEFAVASKHATHMHLYLFDKPVKGKVIKKIDMERQGDKWVAKLDKEAQQHLGLDIEGKNGKKTPVYYGYRAWGANWEHKDDWVPGSKSGFKSHVDDKGNRFNPNKLLTDPYAKEISHDPISPKVQGCMDGTVYATGEEHGSKDSAPLAPKSVFILADETDIGEKPQRAIRDDVIYEVHLRGFTKSDENIPKSLQGTYAGAAMKAKYLKEMGVTMVEFLPIQEFDDDKNDTETYQTNYWGYQTLNFFSPNRRYSSDKTPGGPTREFKEMVKAFHDQGIKVCMDVVYNHSGEGSGWNNDPEVVNEYSMRGLDNQSYYLLSEDPKYDWETSGCGNNMNVANPITRDMVVDSLKYWAEDMGVDSFRFDLAPIIANGRDRNGFSFEPYKKDGLLQRMKEVLDVRSADGKKGSVDLIAEPWAAGGPDAYQLGRFPKEWSEWNGYYRDRIRETLNYPNDHSFKYFADAISGSDSKFYDSRTRSVNFITAHDGFTLKDLFSYNGKNNGVRGFSSDGGSDDNISSDNGNDPVKQAKAMRNAIAMLMLSKGTPMMLGGDEMMRTLGGNNNAYNLDVDGNYLNWNLTDEQKKMREFVKGMINFRKSHAVFSTRKYFNGQDNNNNGFKDITWLKPDATEANGRYFDEGSNSFLGFRIDGTECDDTTSSIYVGFNKGDGDVKIDLPKNTPGKQWYFVADTSEHSIHYNNIVETGKEALAGMSYDVRPRSMMIFMEK